MKRAALLILIFGFIFTSTPLLASGITLRMGPPSVGTGGSNPLMFGPLDFQLLWVTDKKFEYNASVTGLFFGKRHTADWGGYVALGPGLALSAQGGGPGVYSSFGFDVFCGFVCLSADYIQALGFSGGHIVSPYAVRIGASTWW